MRPYWKMTLAALVRLVRKPLAVAGFIVTVFAVFASSTGLLGITYADESATPAEAQRFVKDFGGRAIAALTDPKITTAVRQERFTALLDEGFDVAAIGRFVLARHWRQLTKDQKQQFIALLHKMIVVNYAARFKEFSGVTLHVKGAASAAQGGINVESLVTQPRGGPVKILWKMFPYPGDMTFRVVDVVLDGVSMSITQRSEFAGAIQRLGTLEAFLSDLETRVQRAFNAQ